jgi:hypothetical protein
LAAQKIRHGQRKLLLRQSSFNEAQFGCAGFRFDETLISINVASNCPKTPSSIVHRNESHKHDFWKSDPLSGSLLNPFVSYVIFGWYVEYGTLYQIVMLPQRDPGQLPTKI